MMPVPRILKSAAFAPSAASAPSAGFAGSAKSSKSAEYANVAKSAKSVAIALLLTLLSLLLPAPSALAQDAPPLRVTAQAPSQAQANGTIELQLDVMTSTWFTQPPKLPSLDLPGVMVTPPSGEGSLRREQIGGVAYSGLRYTYLLIPAQPGNLQIPPLTVSAQVGPGGGLVSASSAPLAIAVAGGSSAARDPLADGQSTASAMQGGSALEAGRTAAARRATAGPQASSSTSSTMLARSVIVTQDYATAPDPLVTGGRITRTITQQAEGAQAMSLPAAPLGDVPHFKRYPLEPQVTTLTDGRGGFVGGQRIDRAEYVALDAGTFELPSLTLPWRSAADGAMKVNTVPGRSVTVASAAKADIPFSLADDLARLRQDARWVLPPWVLQTIAVAVPALLLAWLTWPRMRRGVSAARAALHRAQARRRSSESFHWRAWQRESRAAPATLSAFYLWLHRCTGSVTMCDAVTPLDGDSRSQAEGALRQLYGLRNDGLDNDGLDKARNASDDPRQSSSGALARLACATRTWRKAWRTDWRRRAAPPGVHVLPRTLAAFSSMTASRAVQVHDQQSTPSSPTHKYQAAPPSQHHNPPGSVP